MEDKKVFEVPEVTTYDREELELRTVVTGFNGSDRDSTAP